MSLDELFREIFEIIDTYCDEREAAQIAGLINQYVEGIAKKEACKCSECAAIS